MPTPLTFKTTTLVWILCLAGSGCTSKAPESEQESHSADQSIVDPIIIASDAVCATNEPPEPDPASWGMTDDGRFVHPAMTPHQHEPRPFEGQLDYWDDNDYIHNMKVESYVPIVVEPFHTWQNIVDFDGRRYLYQYVRRTMKIFDITDPTNVDVVYEKGSDWGPNGPGDEKNPYAEGDMFGAASIQWSDDLQKHVMVQGFEIRRFGVIEDKRREPDKVDQHRHAPHLKGFKVYAMDGPFPEQWELLSETTTDTSNPDAPIGEQEGSGVRDIPTYFGGKMMYVAAASDSSFGLTEYPTDLYSAGFQAWDMSDPSAPSLAGEFAAPGQRLGEEAAYRENPRCGNRTSWFGARNPIFVPRSIESGGQYGYAAMGGLGLFVLDLTDPSNIRQVGHLDFEPSVAGTEGDFIDVSQVEETGIVYYMGYPLNEDCWEPYKDVYIIDVNDPRNPQILGTLPRPLPPADAPFTDYCQRRGSFGPKRTGYYTQPGVSRRGVLPLAFYNAGVQIFDVEDAANPELAAYFVPRFDTERTPEWARGNLAHGIYVEYDRNLIWLFTNHGFYALSTPLLGEPRLSAPEEPWPRSANY